MKRAFFALGSLAMTTGCLITDPPQFDLPKHTRPLLIADTANQDPRAIVEVDEASPELWEQGLTFSADVVSQEDAADPTSPSAFTKLYATLYLDYGWHAPNPGYLPPFRYSIVGDVESGRAEATWYPSWQGSTSPGCHRVTLMVFHVADDLGCPACPDDYSSITWQVLRCNSSEGTCAGLPAKGEGSCEGFTNTCEQVRANQAEKNPEDFQACPEGKND